ncbi:recombinase family protein [Saccharothrix deserti]|uniref:recombinase family protein n=1 Tax=Saccharothrix deserti TaxID=2593674 RepID=UPI001EE44AE1|nr:recombinase family protein [Saccharothrix deserti]
MSDLARSPFGLPLALHAKEVRAAWVGRTSTEEHQDPRQSLLRQLERCKVVLPESWVIVCHFYDVESGRMELERRGRGTDYERFDIPIARDGGIADLLVEAARPARRFDVVICESMSRIARKMFETLSVERELERAEVPVFASNEPILLTGGRAQQILQRRINQSVAEYEVLNMLELSWGGTCTHIREGYNIGKPPYGYRAKTMRHPNAAKAEKGVTKTRLEPDGAHAETVTLIAKWRYHEQLGFDTIAERLNQDLDRYPPPMPPGGTRARGAWSKSSVAEVLKNPKYTGYQVYNRRARRSRGARNRHNPPELWVWSTEPAHEPLIPKWMFDELIATRTQRQGSRDGTGLKKDPRVRRTYLLRRRVLCDCGRSMIGMVRSAGIIYYRCHPAGNNRGRPDKHEGHPPTVYVREDLILDRLDAFFTERVFGPRRRELLLADINNGDDTRSQELATQRQRLQRKIADATRKQDNLLHQAEDADPRDPFAQGLRQRYNDLENERQALLATLHELDNSQPETIHPTTGQADLLDALPHLVTNLRRAPTDLLNRLFDLTKLTIQIHYGTDQATITASLPADNGSIAAIGEAVAEKPEPHAPECNEPAGQELCASCECPRRGTNRQSGCCSDGFRSNSTITSDLIEADSARERRSLDDGLLDRLLDRTIHALAGKTWTPRTPSRRPRDHPRTGGED